MDLLGQGLWLSVLGMGVTFGALAVLIVVILLLKRLFPVRSAVVAPAAAAAHEDAEAERRVAILAALWVYQNQHRSQPMDPNLGVRLQSPPGPFRRVIHPGIDPR